MRKPDRRGIKGANHRNSRVPSGIGGAEMAYTERAEIIRKIEAIRQSTVIAYLTSLRENVSGHMDMDAVREILDHLLAIPNPPVDRLDLFLCSDGGDSSMPWRLVPVIKHYARHFSVLIPFHAYSAPLF